MKNIIIASILLLAISTISFAQERYLEEITDSVLVETYIYAQKDSHELKLDIYTPAFDSEFSRPVYLYAHGGGFSGGNRNDKGIQAFCKKIAMRGYVAVSISYRLTRKGKPSGFSCDCPSYEKLKTFDAAVEDLQDATYFLIQQREALGIDPQKIIVSGSSAGAEMVLNAAYEPPYCYGLDSGPVAYAGVVAMAGAIPNLLKIYDESAIPSMFFHGTCDNLVPYGSAPHHYCTEGDDGYLILNGSYAIAERLRQLGKPYWLHSTCGGDHGLAGYPMDHYFDEIMEFCSQFVLNGSKDQIHTIVPGEHSCEYPEFNFCDEIEEIPEIETSN
ncbi:alpha/beta hydrolase [Sunxiuqinia sp. A32]|uniref:alpha/beta hydrolase n=1 Tax=Sunxiuqinia sp. A32 TaxID=3461496 RepID=UPI0040460692